MVRPVSALLLSLITVAILLMLPDEQPASASLQAANHFEEAPPPTPASTPVPRLPVKSQEPTPSPPTPTPAPTATPAPTLQLLIETGLTRDNDGKVVKVFGFDVATAREVLYPVTKHRALPADYVPNDLVYPSYFRVPGAQLIRSIIGQDLAEMNRASGYSLVVASGYRSYVSQITVFNNDVLKEMALGKPRDEAEELANTQSARPGYSQHQLGTAIDFNWIEDAFGKTWLGEWLAEHSWEYGFVMSYTPKTAERTGYVYEPWHYRWVGRPLARLLHEQNYLDGQTANDEYLDAIWEALEE